MRGDAKISLFGHVGQDPKKPSEKHPDFITFGLAVTQHWKDHSGEKQEHTDWYEVITSQKGLGDLVNNYVKKGDPLYVEGTPKYEVYTNNEGEAKIRVSVNLTKINLLGQRKNDEENIDGSYQPSKSQSNSMKNLDDDNIPF